MEISKIIRSSLFQFISVIFVLGYFLGVLNLHFSDKTNYCIMTYMYEYPQFVRISIPENRKYPQYGLYAYSEGRLTERARKMWFDGIPVLFLPGNSGSHMQARSLASVALRKALSKGYDFHFDFFTMSTNEELSGLYGGVLQSQTRFAAASVSKILSLYKSNKYTKSVPTSVILIGHSMGGLVAKRLLAYPSTLNTTSIVITLAAPLEAPVVNFDVTINNYYTLMNYEWDANVRKNPAVNKMLISFGNGPRDVLMPSGLTSSNDSFISAMTTAVPGVWVSPDHVCIVWCKQLVMSINRYLFSIVDPLTEQITEDQDLLQTRARQFFQANRSMTPDPDIPKANYSMVADAFWYEDNRRIYQVSRPEIDKTTYLMIRLVKYPQNRFVAVEAVNVDDREWIFGCNAKFTYHTHRYCKYATSLAELSRWTGVADDFGRRKLATVNLHNVMAQNPDWTHVIVKVSPTRKPITLNVDINDHASRQIYITVPSDFSFTKTTIITETEPESLYYEIVLKEFDMIHQAYLLYVEPTQSCKAVSYHVSAEIHVPWAKNNEYYHYFTHNKRSPMKLRLYKSNPSVISGVDNTEFVKVTLLLDPQCTYTISITSSWYHRLAQFARNYTPILVPYVAAIILLSTRANILNLKENGRWMTVFSALGSEGVKPYFSLVFARLVTVGLTSIPVLSFLLENASWKSTELQHFTRSLLVLPAYMTALGIVNVGVAVILAIMVFSSQIAHKLMFRIMWRGGGSLAEKVASGLQKAPMIVSCALVGAAPYSCGAAPLAAGAVFYAFMLSKMYEEYLEDYFYKILAKIASRACMFFKKSKKKKSTRAPEFNAEGEKIKWTNLEELEQECFLEEKREKDSSDDALTNLNFHFNLFLMWMVVTMVNIPVLLTWARNFKTYDEVIEIITGKKKYHSALRTDTSYQTGVVLSACSFYIWQMDGPRKNLRYYEAVSALLFTMSVFILALGPFSLTIVNYGVSFMFLVITAQQILDKEIEEETANDTEISPEAHNEEALRSILETKEICGLEKQKTESEESTTKEESFKENEDTPSEGSSRTVDCECSESRIYTVFKNLREKLSFDL